VIRVCHKIGLMRIMGVDYGKKRVGLALSDETGMLAMPLETVETGKAFQRIREITAEKGVGKIVVGMPRNMDGSDGPQVEAVRQFIQSLGRQATFEIKTWDERWTTRMVERSLIEANVSRQKRKKVIDQLAARQILQEYLDAHSNRGP